MANLNYNFPLRKGNNGFFAFNDTIEDMVKENIRSVVMTRKGERKIYKDLGTNIYNYLFEPLTVDVKPKIQKEVIDAVQKYVPLCKVEKVFVLFKEDINQFSKLSSVVLDEHSLLIILQYSVVSANKNFELPNQSLSLIIKSNG